MRKRVVKDPITKWGFIGAILTIAVLYLVVTLLLHTPQPEGSSQCRGSAGCITGEVTKIVDGDTLYIDDFKIRLALTDTPEEGEEGFLDAKNFTSNLCPVGSQAIADQDDLQLKDSYGRILAVVHCGGKNLNEELLDNGHAEILTQYCAESEFGNDSWAIEYGC